MPTVSDIDVTSDDFSVLLSELVTKPALLEHDIERVRSALHQQGGVDRRRAAEIFHTNRIMRACQGIWSEFYLEALTHYFLQYQHGRHTLPAHSENLLLAWLGDGVSIDHANERRLTFRILLRATPKPDRLERRILDAIRLNLLDQSERWLGAGQRSEGVVDALDIQMILRLAYGAAGGYPRRSSHAVTTFLLDLDQQADYFMDPEGWRQLLIDCAARHLSADFMDNANGTSLPDRELEARVVAFFSDGHPSANMTGLQNDVRVAVQVLLDKSEEAPTFCQ